MGLIYTLCTISDPGGIDVNAVPTYFSQLPAGASTTTFVHYAQLFRHGRFAQYDYGVLQNLVVYGSALPPDYPLHLVTSPTMLYVGDGDGFATPMDTTRLAQELPNVIGHEIVKKAGWSHLDFITAGNVGQLVYADIIDRMNLDSGRGRCHQKDSIDNHQLNEDCNT